MSDTTPTTTQFVVRLIAAMDQGDALGVHSAVADAEAAGVSAHFLVAVLASMLQEALANEGYTLGDLHSILLMEAQQ